MKAHINGITVEGTPEEIFDLMGRSGDAGSLRNRKQDDPHKLGIVDTDWMKTFPKVTSGGTTRCSSPCNCTGACEGKTQSDSSIFNLNHSKVSSNS